MKTKRIFQGLIIMGLVALQVSFAQAQMSQARGGWPSSRPSTDQVYGQPTVGNSEQGAEATVSKQSRPSDDISPASKKPTVVGSWLLTINVPDFAPPFDSFKGLWALTQDGILIGSAQGDTTPTPFPSTTPQYGAWAETGRRQFAAAFKSILFDVATGENLGQFKLQSSMTLSDTGDGFNGPFRLTVSDPNGNVVAVAEGTIQAERIKVEPLN